MAALSAKIIRVLIAKPGLDGHDRGAKAVVCGLRDAGMEVVYLGLRLSPEQIVRAAIQEDVDVVGLSCLSNAHLILFPRVVELMKKETDKEILFIAGGIIPKHDISKLQEAGIAGIFGPGTPIEHISKFIKEHFHGRE